MPAIKAVRIHRFGGIETLQVEDVEPSMPDATEILVKVSAASVNPVDFKIRAGKYPAVNEDRLPYILGRDACGIVEKCGAGAEKFKIGDEVFGIVGIHGGGYAQKVVMAQDAVATMCTRQPSRSPDRPRGKACFDMARSNPASEF
jgi:NADPH:quinone reductase-like Zn-dependent oxidoreductase